MAKKRKSIPRRAFLLGLSALAVLATLVTARKFKFKKQRTLETDDLKEDFSAVGTTPLGDRAAAQGLLYGAFPQAGYQDFVEDPLFQSQLVEECRLLVTGFYWNWGGVRPSESTYDFTATDYFAQFAADNNMLLRGHPLVWYRTTPDWLLDKFNNPSMTIQEIENILTDHIATVVGRYAGKVHSWDVVNEAINVEDGRGDGFRDTKISGINDKKSLNWLDFLGIDYIDLAFQIASQADPRAMLTYNEFGLDYNIAEDEAKRTATLKLLENLKAKGTPVHAFGIQAHLDATRNDDFSPQKLRQFLQDVADLDLKIIISELDVRDRFLQGDIASRDRAVARAYSDFLSVALDEPAVVAVATWGLSDRYTWTKDKLRPDGTFQRPLPLDARLNRKLAWKAIAHAFDNAPRR
ncbi:MAG TPA: endo-1,4-beta-xylanase [Coleofasciculaceae cyanobacterium]|jgi:endo-1,4-beta-xylanase